VLQVICVRGLNFLERKGVIESRRELTLLDDAEEWWSFDHSSASSKDHGNLKLQALVMVLRPLLSVVEAHNIERLLRTLVR
jgi:hypothetical protein